jgi:hypothetical protein
MYRRPEVGKMLSQLISEFVNHNWTNTTVISACCSSRHDSPGYWREQTNTADCNLIVKCVPTKRHTRRLCGKILCRTDRQRANIGAVMNGVTSHSGLTVTLNTLKKWKKLLQRTLVKRIKLSLHTSWSVTERSKTQPHSFITPVLDGDVKSISR